MSDIRDIIVDCPECEGTGEAECPLCAGTGIGQHGDPDVSACRHCARDAYCPECDGRGTLDARAFLGWYREKKGRNMGEAEMVLCDFIEAALGEER